MSFKMILVADASRDFGYECFGRYRINYRQ